MRLRQLPLSEEAFPTEAETGQFVRIPPSDEQSPFGTSPATEAACATTPQDESEIAILDAEWRERAIAAMLRIEYFGLLFARFLLLCTCFFGVSLSALCVWLIETAVHFLLQLLFRKWLGRHSHLIFSTLILVMIFVDFFWTAPFETSSSGYRLFLLYVFVRSPLFAAIGFRSTTSYLLLTIPWFVIIGVRFLSTWWTVELHKHQEIVAGETTDMDYRTTMTASSLVCALLLSLHFGCRLFEQNEMESRQEQTVKLEQSLCDRRSFRNALSHVIRTELNCVVPMMDYVKRDVRFAKDSVTDFLRSFSLGSVSARTPEDVFGTTFSSLSATPLLRRMSCVAMPSPRLFLARSAPQSCVKANKFATKSPNPECCADDNEPQDLEKSLAMCELACDSLLQTSTSFHVSEEMEMGTFASNMVWCRPLTTIRNTVSLQKMLRIDRGEGKKDGVEIILDCPDCDDDSSVFVKMDKVRVCNVVTNLVSNAVKYTEQGTITISFGLQDDRLWFCCLDTGIGIPFDQIHLVFVPYSKVNAQSMKSTTNLGLCISRQVIRRLGGNLTIESDGVGHGTVARFWIPISEVRRDNDDAGMMCDHPFLFHEAKNGENDGQVESIDPEYPIVVVDDVRSNVMMFLQNLAHYGYTNIHSASNGVEGFELLFERWRLAACNDEEETWKPPLVLMDINMPKMDGKECTLRIREAGIPCIVVACTAAAISGSRAAFVKRYKFDGVLFKPLTFATLRRVTSLFCRQVSSPCSSAPNAPLSWILRSPNFQFPISQREDEDITETCDNRETETDSVPSVPGPITSMTRTDVAIRIPAIIFILLMKFLSAKWIGIGMTIISTPFLVAREVSGQEHAGLITPFFLVASRLCCGPGMFIEGMLIVVIVNMTHLHHVSTLDLWLSCFWGVVFSILSCFPSHGLLDLSDDTKFIFSLCGSWHILVRLACTSFVHRSIVTTRSKERIADVVRLRKRLSRHLSHISKTVHDARDPLSVLVLLLGDLKIMIDRKVLHHSVRARVEELLLCSRRGVRACCNYMNDLSAIFKLRYDKMPLFVTVCNIGSVLRSVLSEESLYASVTIELSTFNSGLDGLEVLIDREKCTWIVNRLIVGALAACYRLPDSGPVEIAVELDDSQQQPSLIVRIADSGLHDPLEFGLELALFDLKESLPLSVETLPGISLAVSRALASLLGGSLTISCSGEDVEGVTIAEFRLPLRFPVSETSATPVADFSQLSILVIDDSSIQLKVMNRLLRSGLGCCSVATYFSWREFSQTIVQHREYRDHQQPPPSPSFDLACVDLNLKTESGLDVIRRIRDLFPTIRTALMTGDPTVRLCDVAEHSVDEVLIKPITKEHLESVLLSCQAGVDKRV